LFDLTQFKVYIGISPLIEETPMEPVQQGYILAAVQKLEPLAFAGSLARELSRVHQQHVALAYVLVQLERAEDAGLVMARLDPTTQRLAFFITEAGKQQRGVVAPQAGHTEIPSGSAAKT
jgi:ABC-type hemin transport system ATPase subunit